MSITVNKKGVNPFSKNIWNANIRQLSCRLSGLIYYGGYIYSYEKNKLLKEETIVDKKNILNISLEPFVLLEDGITPFYYQRGFVWSLEDKQELINSIYNYKDIGKFIIKSNSFTEVLDNIDIVDSENSSCFYDMVDGKQRFDALIGFLNGDFSDKNGLYFKEFDKPSQRKFLSTIVSIGEVGEDASDMDVIRIFLNVNQTGVKMDKKYLESVSKIKIKKDEEK